MDYKIKIISIIIIAILLISIYFIFFYDTEEHDEEAPVIDYVSGNIDVYSGEIARINVTFSDNVEVTNATIFYKKETSTEWSSESILNGSINISIPLDPIEDWYYYITIDDAAGNGPVGDPSVNGSIYYVITVTDSNNNNNQNGNYSHIVFVEEGTGTWCSNCPAVAEVIHDMFDPDDPEFYYVSMVEDKNTDAKNRLENDYNILGYPTVYIDGGYRVIFGQTDFRTKFENQIENAKNRNVPNLILQFNSEWNESENELINNVIVENIENEKYTGRLKIYITEINSNWLDYDNHRYNYAFIDYGYNNAIEINSNDTITITENWPIPDNVDKDNLMVIAVIFNSNSNQAYSRPDTNENAFDAYYADVVAGTKVTEETAKLPPAISIQKPKGSHHYIFNNERSNMLFPFTYIIGNIDIEVFIESEAEIEKVEYTITGRFRTFNATVNNSPYSYNWDFFSFGKYTIKVEIFDVDGDTATDEIEVFAFQL